MSSHMVYYFIVGCSAAPNIQGFCFPGGLAVLFSVQLMTAPPKSACAGCPNIPEVVAILF